jgi:hypothetical protein
MGGKTTKQTTTNTFGWQTKPETADISAVRDFQFDNNLLDAALDRRYGLADEEIENQANSAFGFGVPAHLRQAQANSQRRNLMFDKSALQLAGQQSLNQARFGQKMAVAGLTDPVLTQTGGTSVTKENPGIFQNVLGGIMGAAALGAKF